MTSLTSRDQWPLQCLEKRLVSVSESLLDCSIFILAVGLIVPAFGQARSRIDLCCNIPGVICSRRDFAMAAVLSMWYVAFSTYPLNPDKWTVHTAPLRALQ